MKSFTIALFALAFSANALAVSYQYQSKVSYGRLIQLKSPTYTDDAGNVFQLASVHNFRDGKLCEHFLGQTAGDFIGVSTSPYPAGPGLQLAGYDDETDQMVFLDSAKYYAMKDLYCIAEQSDSNSFTGTIVEQGEFVRIDSPTLKIDGAHRAISMINTFPYTDIKAGADLCFLLGYDHFFVKIELSNFKYLRGDDIRTAYTVDFNFKKNENRFYEIAESREFASRALNEEELDAFDVISSVTCRYKPQR